MALTTPALRNSQPSRFPVRAATSAPTAANVIEVGMKPSVAPQVSPPAGADHRARGQQHDRDAEQRPRQPAGLALSYLRHRTLPPRSFTCASTNPTQ
ncbi:MAG TPA: hypothetical protein VGD83_18415 [Streptosporangiaceae bacterium]